MKTKITLAAVAAAFALLVLPVNAQAFHHRGHDKSWRCHMFGWIDHSRGKKVVVKKGKKKYAKKATKKDAK
jgi:hypothetical protein